MSHPSPPRLQKAKAAAVTAAVVATTAALTAGVASSAPEALLAQKRTVHADVDLSAAALPSLPKVPDLIGIYGVGPVFWAAQLLGLTPDNVIKAATGMLGGTEMATAVTQLLDVLAAVSPVEAGIKGPLPSDVYNAVNGLKYTTSGVAEMLGLDKFPIVNKLLDELIKAAPILNQRRAIIFSESMGGLTTSLAYRDMINAVQSNSDDWGVGVTGQWLIFFNNPSRPGGGLFALATPFTDLLGMNLSTPDAGSYTNGEANGGKITKVLNTSILDITWAYNPLSDAPTTLNPLAWANAAAGGVFLTYLLPSEGNNIGSHVLPQLVGGALDGVKVMLDATGGQGLDMVPGWTGFVDALSKIGLGGLLDDITDATKFPGTGTYITYDSGNLPLLEPFRMAPRMANLIPGVHIPTPVTDSFEEALRMMVNMGYQDVDPDDLERDFDMGGEQAHLWHSPLTPTQRLAANQTVFNALVDGIQDNALTPAKWTTTIPGMDFAPIVQNPVSEAGAKALRDALETLQDAANPAFDAAEKGLAPVTNALDGIDTQVTTAIDRALKVKEPSADTARTLAAKTSTASSDHELRTVKRESRNLDANSGADKRPTPLKNALKDNEISKGLKKVTDSLKARPGKHAADRSDPVKKSVKETVDKMKKAGKDSAAKKKPAKASGSEAA